MKKKKVEINQSNLFQVHDLFKCRSDVKYIFKKNFLQKKVDPNLQVEVKPSIRARKIQEDKLRRQTQKEEFWRRREAEDRWREEMR